MECIWERLADAITDNLGAQSNPRVKEVVPVRNLLFYIALPALTLP